MIFSHLFRSSAVISLALGLAPRVDAQYPQYEIREYTRGSVRTSDPVEYRVTFTNLWTEADHPHDYPHSAHWSWPVVTAHNSGYKMWEEEMGASEGVVTVAETGGFSTLTDEIEASGLDYLNWERGAVQYPQKSVSQTIEGMCVDEQHPFVSAITMIAPSPDWFSGFHDFLLSFRRRWYDSVTIDVYPWDAGSDSGTAYSSKNDATLPRDHIAPFPEDQLDAVFVTEDDTSGDLVIKPVASFTFERVASSGACLSLSEEKRQAVANLSNLVWTQSKGGNALRTCAFWAAWAPLTRCFREIPDGKYAGMLTGDVCKKECYAFSH